MLVIRDARPPASSAHRRAHAAFLASPAPVHLPIGGEAKSDEPCGAPPGGCERCARVAPQHVVAAIGGLAGQAYSLPAALDLIGEPAALLDLGGATICVNRAFRAAQDEYRPMIVALLRGEEGKWGAGDGAALRYDPETGRVARKVMLRDADGVDRGMLIVLRSPGQTARCFEPALLEQAFNLTPAEARLACALMRTKSLAAAIKELGLKEKTGRTYLDRVFQKTGARSQLQLYATLMDLYLVSGVGA